MGHTVCSIKLKTIIMSEPSRVLHKPMEAAVIEAEEEAAMAMYNKVSPEAAEAAVVKAVGAASSAFHYSGYGHTLEISGSDWMIALAIGCITIIVCFYIYNSTKYKIAQLSNAMCVACGVAKGTCVCTRL